MKRWVAGLFVTALFALSSAGASQVENFNAEGFPIVDEPVTLTLMGARHPIHGAWEEMLFFEEMSELTNLRFNFVTPPLEGYTERKSLAFVSGDLPDVFFGGLLTATEEVEHGEQGTLLALEDLIERYGPNIQAMFEANPDVRPSITAPDGHIYSLPFVNKASAAVTPPVWVNPDWMETLDVTELPQTTDELYELLVRFRDEDPNQTGQADTIPYTAENIDAARLPILAAFGHLAAGIEEREGRVVFTPIEEGFRDYLAFMRTLYEERLLDNEIFTNDFTQMVAKGKAGRVGTFIHAGPFLVFPVDVDDTRSPVLPALIASGSNEERVYPINSGVTRGTFAITNRNPHPEATIRWVDHLFFLEGSILVHYGPEGVFWEWADEEAGLRRYRTPPEGMGTEEWRGTLTPDPGIPLPLWVREEVERGWESPGHQHRFAETEEKLSPYGRVPFPDIYLTRDEQRQVTAIMTDLETYVESMEAAFITGREPLERWDAYVNTIRGMGVDELIAIHQAAYDRWAAVQADAE